MQIGIPKEMKELEGRVSTTPNSVSALVGAGYKVIVEDNAGVYCNYTNEDYIAAGAIIGDQNLVYESDIILKVKEPMPCEYHLFKENQTIIGFLHLAANPECVGQMLSKKIKAIACENIVIDGEFKLLKPVSEIAGRKALFTAIYYSEIQNGGQGILLSGTSVAKPGIIYILGGGIVAQNACDMALAIGCQVKIFEINDQQITYLKEKYHSTSVEIVNSNVENISKSISECDVLISTVLIPGEKAPKLITNKMIKSMKPGSVIVDVSADQGGVVENEISVTTQKDPVIKIHNTLLYAVPNMPASVPKTATDSIQGIVDLLVYNKHEILATGIQLENGHIINQALKEVR